ncbi:MAG TPA: hypothetical protein VHC95_00485 [Opitutales bacterium]|nr:hypothetical protein [Opitutales bacterium]
MNKHLLTAVLALSLVASAHAQSSGPLANLTVSGTFDYESQYVFRGKKVTNSALQPMVNFAYPVSDGTVNAYVWTSNPLGRQGTATPGGNNEIDIGIYYQHAIPGIDNTTGEVGYQLYWYPNFGNGVGATAASRTHEFHVGAIYDTTSLLNYNLMPTVKWYHDVILDSDTLTGSIGYSWDLSDASGLKGLSLNPLATLGWTGMNRTFGDVAGQNWRNSYLFWELDLELDYKFNSNTTLFFAGHYAGQNDGTAGGFAGGNPSANGSNSGQIWLGLGVKWNM